MVKKQRLGIGIRDAPEERYDKFIGKYVFIYTAPSGNFAGRIDRIEEDDIILNPYLQRVYLTKPWPTNKFIEEDSMISLINIIAIEPTTRENLEAYCRIQTENNKKQYERDFGVKK